ncbi:MAG: ABC-2 transporter permease [Erysipelotrichaceae bacterium]|nr:ABC-2 transporter permease [Erysipelotrichaceae bacterium]
MRNIMRKEMKLCASPITYWFILFGLMFFLPGYPILCGAFFTTLGIYQGFLYAREANDIEFSALLPIGKKDVVKGKYLFVCLIEGCALLLMLAVALIRMTALADSVVYLSNALMNANLFALGGALLIFGVFNVVFLGGFFKTAYNMGKPFIIYIIVSFMFIIVLEALHHFPELGVLNSFGFDNIGLQVLLLLMGLAAFVIMTLLSYRRSCRNFEKIDL